VISMGIERLIKALGLNAICIKIFYRKYIAESDYTDDYKDGFNSGYNLVLDNMARIVKMTDEERDKEIERMKQEIDENDGNLTPYDKACVENLLKVG